MSAGASDFYVYCLENECGEPFYVGCTNLLKRYDGHLKFARFQLLKNSQIEKNLIITRMLDAGLKPGFRVIAEGLTREQGHAREREIIANIGRLCLGTGPLTNMHPGGMPGGSKESSAAILARTAGARAAARAAKETERLEAPLRRAEAVAAREASKNERALQRAADARAIPAARRGVNKLTVRGVAAIVRPGRYSDGAGLYLRIDGRPDGLRRNWVFRFSWRGTVREMGLGAYPAISLAQARKARETAARHARDGIDPIAARDAARQPCDGKPTFGDCATALLAAKASEWRNAKHCAQWRMTLETYAAVLWHLPVDEVSIESVLAVLQPIWQAKPETASRLRGRIETVLDAARAKGHIARNEANPARWRGHLEMLLPKRQKLSRGHHAALAYADVPAFMTRLRGQDGMAALALRFLILTAARTGEALGARWDEINIGIQLWTLPAARMKASREHRVPLSKPAMGILEKLNEARSCEFVFFGLKRGRPLSTTAFEMLLDRMQARTTVHGFRSAFRDWCGDQTSFPREVAEAALSHVVGDKAEQAYRRGDALEKRRALMNAWSGYCEPRSGSNIVALKKKV